MKTKVFFFVVALIIVGVLCGIFAWGLTDSLRSSLITVWYAMAIIGIPLALREQFSTLFFSLAMPISLASTLLGMFGVISFVPTIVITEAVKITLILLVSAELSGKLSTSVIFWSLLSFIAITDGATLLMISGSPIIPTITISFISLMVLWFIVKSFYKKAKEVGEKTEIDKINAAESVIIITQSCLRTGFFIVALAVLGLVAREIFTPSFDSLMGVKIAINVICILAVFAALIITGFIRHQLLDKKLDALWEKKKMLFA